MPNEIFDDLGFASCPIYEPEVQSASIGAVRRAADPALQRSRAQLLDHLGDTLGIEAVLGMAEVAAWAEAPARAIGRFDVRKPPKSLDEMWAVRGQRDGAPGHPHRHVRQRDGRGRPVPPRPREARPDPQHAGLSGRQLHLPGPLLAGKRALPGLRPGLAGRRHHVQGARAASGPCPTTSWACSSSTAASSAATPRSPGSSPPGTG